jgi:hypothetical protein
MKLLNTPRWETYKNFYQITVFRYLTMWFSIVPILAGVLSQLPEYIPINISGTIYNLKLELPFNWLFLWASSFFFLISFVVYLMRCPVFIKQYNKFSDYSSYGHDKRWVSWLAKDLVEEGSELPKFISRLNSKQYLTRHSSDFVIPPNNPEVGTEQTIYYMRVDGKIYSLGMPRLGEGEADKDAERAIFWEIFGRYSNSRKWARTCIRFFLFLSLLSFIAVFVQHVFSGLVYLVPWLEKFAPWLANAIIWFANFVR